MSPDVQITQIWFGVNWGARCGVQHCDGLPSGSPQAVKASTISQRIQPKVYISYLDSMPGLNSRTYIVVLLLFVFLMVYLAYHHVPSKPKLLQAFYQKCIINVMIVTVAKCHRFGRHICEKYILKLG